MSSPFWPHSFFAIEISRYFFTLPHLIKIFRNVTDQESGFLVFVLFYCSVLEGPSGCIISCWRKRAWDREPPNVTCKQEGSGSRMQNSQERLVWSWYVITIIDVGDNLKCHIIIKGLAMNFNMLCSFNLGKLSYWMSSTLILGMFFQVARCCPVSSCLFYIHHVNSRLYFWVWQDKGLLAVLDMGFSSEVEEFFWGVFSNR